nr:hypothetical protein [Kitasatospora fiedleri]
MASFTTSAGPLMVGSVWSTTVLYFGSGWFWALPPAWVAAELKAWAWAWCWAVVLVMNAATVLLPSLMNGRAAALW